jgi:Uma2 family endonuclease
MEFRSISQDAVMGYKTIGGILLTVDEQDRFGPLCPDFVVELMSPSDTIGAAI